MMNNNVDSDRPILGHLISHLNPEIAQFMKEKFNRDYSQIANMTLADWAAYGQLGIDAKFALEVMTKIEEIEGDVIDSIEKFNQVIQRSSKKGIKAVQGLEKGAVELAIALKGRNSAILEGQHKLKNADTMFAELRATNNQIDQISNGMVLARAIAELNNTQQKALNEPAVQAALRHFNESKKSSAKAAKMALQHGLAAFNHPQFPGNEGVEDWGQYDHLPASQNLFSYQSQQPLKSANPDSIAFNWSGNVAGGVKQFSSNVVKGAKEIGKWFGIS